VISLRTGRSKHASDPQRSRGESGSDKLHPFLMLVFASPFRAFSLRSRHPERQWGENRHRGRLLHRHPNHRLRSPRRLKTRIGGRSLRQGHSPLVVPQAHLPQSVRVQSQTSVIAMVTAKVLSTVLGVSAPDASRGWRGCVYLPPCRDEPLLMLSLEAAQLALFVRL